MHRHKAIHSRDWGFTGPVNHDRRNPAADGNICTHEECGCGATRRINLNGRHRETGPWLPHSNDARGWDDLRRAEGYSGTHH